MAIRIGVGRRQFSHWPVDSSAGLKSETDAKGFFRKGRVDTIAAMNRPQPGPRFRPLPNHLRACARPL